jgi:UDP-2,3-diacylglucosamine pyrophosphatase LpxH
MHRILLLLLSILLGGCVTSAKSVDFVRASTPHFSPSTSSSSKIYVISDLHLGVGRKRDGTWDPTEDFRWSNALRGFLDFLRQDGADNVDLIIDGDFLELWQPPDSLCKTHRADDEGCSVDEAAKLATQVVRAHTEDLAALADFAKEGNNRLEIVPGNHDAALLLPKVWGVVAPYLKADTGRVNLVSTGVWISADGQILIEHGHQIGLDVNRFSHWPQILVASDGARYIERPWGEQFVQQIFNKEESTYSSIIDNLNPESVGASLRMEDRGTFGSIADMAKFVAFNLFQTSVHQKYQAAGGTHSLADKPAWNPKVARLKGRALFANALERNDPMWPQLHESHLETSKLGAALDQLARDEKALPDSAVLALCDRAAILHPQSSNLHCVTPEAGGLIIEKLFLPRRWVLKEHLLKARSKFDKVRFFVYGHTHTKEIPWLLKLSELRAVTVANTGAFQRTVDEKHLKKLAKVHNMKESEALRKLSPEDLPPVYGGVRISRRNSKTCIESFSWTMSEHDKSGKLKADFVDDDRVSCR